MIWHIITGEYPPQSGGVSDYSRAVALALAAKGDHVEVWAPPCLFESAEDGVRLHRLPDHFGIRSIAALQSGIRLTPDTRVLIQYVPHAFGWKAMNVPFCIWAGLHFRKSLRVMFHEVAYPIERRQPQRHNLLGLMNRTMAFALARHAQQIFVSTPAWKDLLHRSLIRRDDIHWVPVPGNIPRLEDSQRVRATRSRLLKSDGILLGHFGTYGPLIAEPLMQILPAILNRRPDCILLLIGRGSQEFRSRLGDANPALDGRIEATGPIPPSDVSCNIGACDLFVQYYPDGITTRRTSAMALLEHARPIVTTVGHLTEPEWQTWDAVALAPVNDPAAIIDLALKMIDDQAERHRLACAAAALYDERFALRHTIDALRNTHRRSN